MGRLGSGSTRRCLLAALVVVAVLGASGAACNNQLDYSGRPGPTTSSSTAPASPTSLQPEVIASYPHDASAYTQGLETDGGRLYESTGQRGRSSLREVRLGTGEVLRRVDLASPLFGEGIAIVGDRIIQLTWQEHTALVYDLETLEQTGTFTYDTEGWGLCWDGTDVVMSDGTDTLYRRDPDTFEVRSVVKVTRDGRPLGKLNELECVDGRVWSNVYQTDEIVEIDPSSGEVTATVDASGLLAGGGPSPGVLNGIAYDDEDGTFLVTGKNWPSLFRVRFVTADGEPAP